MSFYALLTVDLNNYVDEDARDEFNEYLKDKNFVKLKLTTTWRVTFTAGTETGALALTKKVVADAAAAAGIQDYEAAVIFGQNPHKVWNQAG